MERTESKLAYRATLLATAIALIPLGANAQDNDDIPELDALEVTAGEEGPQGPDLGYTADRSLTATKTDTPLSETPRSVSVATRQQIEDQGARNLTDILQYMPGVNPSAEAGGDTLASDTFYIRGMNQRDYGYGTYRDGLRLQPNAYSTSAEPYGLERVEVLKGPTSILYGENAPGGMVNMVSKRPTDMPQGELNLSYGSHDRKEVSADVSGALTDDGDVSGRLVFLGRRAETQTEGVDDDRIYLAPSVTFRLTDRDTLTLLSMYQKDDTEIQLAQPAAGTLLDHPGGQLEPGDSLGNTDWDDFDREFWSLGWEYEHEFNDNWAFRQNARYMRSRVERQETWREFAVVLADGLGIDPATLGALIGSNPAFAPLGTDGFASYQLAYGLDRSNESRTYAIDNQLVGNFISGGFEHTLLTGLAYDKTSFDQVIRSSEQPSVDMAATPPLDLNEFVPVDIFDPQYAGPPATSDTSSDSESDQEMYGAYGQLQSRYNNVIGLLGARYDFVDTRYRDRATGTDDDFSDEELTWQAGLMYEFDFGLSPYMNYATSFIPAAREAAEDTGEPLRPVTGEQYEIGFKYQPAGVPASINVAAFDLTRKNDITSDGSGGGFRQIGRTESEGVEIEVVGDLTDNISLSAAYTYLDAVVAEDPGAPNTEGEQVAGQPRHQASLWTSYSFHSGSLRGLQAGVGVRYLGSSKAYPNPVLGYGDSIEVDDQTLVDLAIGYRFAENWRVGMNVKNVADEEYVARCNNAGGCYWGAGRTVQGTLSYNY